jgi:hypothetical protein
VIGLKNISITLSVLLVIVLFGCQQSHEGPDYVTKPNEVATKKASNENYDISGIVSEVIKDHKRVLLTLTKHIQEDEEQMWVTIDGNTKITDKKGAFIFEDFKKDVRLKANLSKMCKDFSPRICFAEEIVIQ